jgi:hypothetical protein
MNRREQKLLGPIVKAGIRGLPDSWNRCKYEVSNYGNREFYPLQSDFYPPVDRLMDGFDEATRVSLIEAWLTARPKRRNLPDRAILMSYRAMIIETIVHRAEVAAYRSNHREI